MSNDTIFDERLIGAIAVIKIAQTSNMINDEQIKSLLTCFLKAHGIPPNDIEVSKLLVANTQLESYLIQIVDTNK